MKDFRPLWKELANKKQITTAHNIQRCILIGMHRGETFDEKVEYATQKLARAFTRKLRNPVKVYEQIGDGRYGFVEHPYYALEYNLKYYAKSNRGLCRELDLSDDEGVEYDKIVEELQKPSALDKLDVHYSYIMLFGNLMPEQRCIQLGHAMLKMGSFLEATKSFPPGVTPDNLHFCMVDGDGLTAADENYADLVRAKFQYVEFNDYDYSFDKFENLVQSEKTSLKAIVTHPIHWCKRGKLAECELYRFESNGSD